MFLSKNMSVKNKLSIIVAAIVALALFVITVMAFYSSREDLLF